MPETGTWGTPRTNALSAIYSYVKRLGYQITLFIYSRFLSPKSTSEDLRRREFILNIILSSSLIFVSFLDLTVLYNSLWQKDYNGVPFPLFSLIVLLFLGIYVLSRFGYFILASYMFIGIYFSVTTFSAYRWGSYLPSTLLNYVLLIIISSILISTRFGFVVTCFISSVLGLIGYREVASGINLTDFWKDKAYRFNDVIEFIITFFVIMSISWLSNREIEKSLRRARKSEIALAKERDNLEITVEQRTRKLRELQTERVTELHRLAESGRQAAGFFHDLMNPLTAIAISVEELKFQSPAMAKNVEFSLDQALAASHRMESFIDAIRRQSKSEEIISSFSLNEEIEQALLLLEHRAKRSGVELQFIPKINIEGTGKPIQFYQIISNLVSNAIESYNGLEREQKRVLVTLSSGQNKVYIKVSDQGKGIPEKVKHKIFDHFFTTKSQAGMGLGLAIIKNIIEKELHGTIYVSSSSQGTTFTVVFPLQLNFSINKTIQIKKRP